MSARPCIAQERYRLRNPGYSLVRVAPVTHRAPDAKVAAVEIPAAVKRHRGLDTERSWVVVDEVNEFIWPGYDLRPIAGSRDVLAYGFLPPRLFENPVGRMREVWAGGWAKATPRE